MTEIDHFLPCGCAIHKSGARIYCDTCDTRLHEAVAYGPNTEDWDFPMAGRPLWVMKKTKMQVSEHVEKQPGPGNWSLDPELPDATVSYLETRIDGIEGHGKYLQAKLQEHLNATAKKVKGEGF